LKGQSAMQLAPREHTLVERVIQKIKEFDPQAIVEMADDTLEHEDILLYVYTDKGSPDIIHHTTPCLGDILVHEDLDILVIPRDREKARTACGEILCLSVDGINGSLLVSFSSITLNRITVEEKAHDDHSDG
jgi:hypothetical protein